MSKADLRVFNYLRKTSNSLERAVAFDWLVNQLKGKADAVAVMSPEALGDSYHEVMANLEKLANAELLLLIIPSSHRGAGQSCLERN
jgi:hypothetical protein